MHSTAPASGVLAPRRSTLGLFRPILIGGGLAGALDIIAAIGRAELQGGSTQRVLQAIASGIIGRRAFEGGWMTALLGLEAHFLIALSASAVFVLAARVWPQLKESWQVTGPLYGICVWAMMAFVVVPLSAAPFTIERTLAGAAIAILIHIFCVGLPIAWAAKRG